MNKKSLLYLFFFANLGIILFFWSQSSFLPAISEQDNMLIALGRVFGLFAVFFALLQFLLMGRTAWIEKLYGLDKLAILHHYNGFFTITFIILHPIFIISGYAQVGKVSFITQYIDALLHYPHVWLAATAQVLFITIVFASIYIVRKHLKYETWYYIHVFTYLAIILAFWHQLPLGSDFTNPLFTYYWYLLYGFVAINVLYFRFTKMTLSFLKHQFVVEKLVKETNNATSVYITGKKMNEFLYTPGQFVILRFFSKGRWWQAHPFSLSFIPKDNHLRVTIKNSGDFTAEINSLKPGTKVFVDGPYGSFTLDKAKLKSKLLFIAGGIGITPIRTLLEQAVGQGRNSMLLYAHNEDQRFVFEEEIATLAKKGNMTTVLINSNKAIKFKGERGRIDAEKLKKLVPDLKKREVFLCGPVPMIKGLKKELEALGVPHEHIHFEKFSLH